MSETDGKKLSLVESQIESFETQLNEMQARLFPISLSVDESIINAVHLSYEQLSKIHPDECNILAFKLKQYAIYLQQKENRFRTLKNWTLNKLNVIVGQEASNYGNTYTKFEEKRLNVIAGNTFATLLNKKYLEYSSYENELSFLSSKITELAKALSDIRYNKLQQSEK